MKGFEAIRRGLAARSPERLTVAGAAQASVALVLAGSAGDLELLLIKRSEHPRDPWSGHAALPGGRWEPADPDLGATARRETLEETGIALSEGDLLGELDDLHPMSRSLPRIVVRPFVFGLPRRPRVRAGGEVAGHVWVPLAELPAAAGRAVVLVGGRRREVDAYRVGALTVWGLTERILAQFFERAALGLKDS